MTLMRTTVLGLSLCMTTSVVPALADTQDELNALKLALPLTTTKRPADETFEDVNDRIAKLYGHWLEVTRLNNNLNLPDSEMFEKSCREFGREISPWGDLGLEVSDTSTEGEIRLNYLFAGGWTFAALPDEDTFRRAYFENGGTKEVRAETLLWRSTVMSFAADFELIPSGDNTILELLPRAGFRVWARCPNAG